MPELGVAVAADMLGWELPRFSLTHLFLRAMADFPNTFARLRNKPPMTLSCATESLIGVSELSASWMLVTCARMEGVTILGVVVAEPSP